MNYQFLYVVILLSSCNQVNTPEQDISDYQLPKDSVFVESKTAEPKKILEVSDTTIYGVKKEIRNRNIESIISAFKKMDIEEISKLVEYPIERYFPIPSINNALEFQNRFHQIFDPYLINLVKNSSLKDWHEDDFGIWLFFVQKDNSWDRLYRLNHSGLITDIRHLSEKEEEYKNKLIEIEKKSLHSSLREYILPYIKIKTDNYLIRIDELKNDKYRYASWKKGKKESSKPDLVIYNGELIPDKGGSRIIFYNKEFTYEVEHHFIGGKRSPEYSLNVKKGEKLMLIEAGVSNHNNEFEYLEQIEKDLKSFMNRFELTREELIEQLNNFNQIEKNELTRGINRIMNIYGESLDGLIQITRRINKKYYWDI